MGFIKTPQRRAIESLRKWNNYFLPDCIEFLNIFLEDDKRLYIVGVSAGIGTCSDIKDMSVLVLSESFIEKPYIPPGTSIKSSEFAVLLRKPTLNEIYNSPGAKEAPRLTVELLKPQSIDIDKIVFEKTKKINCYVNHF